MANRFIWRRCRSRHDLSQTPGRMRPDACRKQSLKTVICLSCDARLDLKLGSPPTSKASLGHSRPCNVASLDTTAEAWAVARAITN